LIYGVLGLYWALGGAGFPFGSGNDPQQALSVLGGVRTETGAPVIAVLGLVGAVAAVATTRMRRRRGVLRAALRGFAWIAAAALALVIPDYRVLVAVVYTPIVLIGAPFDLPPGVSILDVFPWPVVNQFFCICGGLLWAATAVAYGRRTGGACESCGRDDARAGWTTPESAARWGRWATYTAVIIPVLCASLVAVLVTTAGLMFVLLTLTGRLGAILGEGVLSAENWAALAPELLWPLWGAALGAATLAYYYRRRSRCGHCGQV
jgi:hypothetical protein